MKTAWIVGILIAATGIAWAKDELIPTKPKTHGREAPPNPIRGVAGDMHTVGRRLQETKTDATTQEMEKAIVDKLDILIEAARQQQEQQSKGGQGDAKQRQPKQPQPQPEPEKQKAEDQAKKPTKAEEKQQKQADRPGLGRPGVGEGKGDLHTDAEEWGNLPPAIRDQLLQTQGEGFPLKYRELLRRYYRGLSKAKD